ncbi:MAG: winged helix-turn-helix domain-containing protein [Terriglobia bacterium]
MTKSRTKRPEKDLNILKLIHSHGGGSRVELAHRAGVSAASVTTIVRRLINQGLVVESGEGPKQIGRRRIPLTVRGVLPIWWGWIWDRSVFAWS